MFVLMKDTACYLGFALGFGDLPHRLEELPVLTFGLLMTSCWFGLRL
jgi:hypothetical protein